MAVPAHLSPFFGYHASGKLPNFNPSFQVFQRGFTMGQDIQTARVPGSSVKDEISHKVTICESGLEDLTREEAPVSSEGKICRLERHKFGWNLCQQDCALEA